MEEEPRWALGLGSASPSWILVRSPFRSSCTAGESWVIHAQGHRSTSMLNQGWNPDDFTLACVFLTMVLAVKNLPASLGDLRDEFDLWRRKQQPTSVFLTGKSHGQRSLGRATVAVSCIRLKWLGTHAHREGVERSRIQEATWRLIQPPLVLQVPTEHRSVPGTVRGTKDTAETNRDSLDPFWWSFHSPCGWGRR